MIKGSVLLVLLALAAISVFIEFKEKKLYENQNKTETDL